MNRRNGKLIGRARRRRCAAGLGATLVGAVLLPTPALLTAAATDHRPETIAIVRDDEIAEASGLVADPDAPVFYTVQDAGTDDTNVYGVGPSGETVLTVAVPGVENEDWEDLALGVDEAGAPALFIGDIGDAYFSRRAQQLGPRTEYSVIRIAKPAIDAEGEPAEIEAADVRVWRFDYADEASHNAESLLVQPGTNRIFVIDKTEQATREAYMWVAPDELDDDGINTFELVGEVPVTGASGASFSPSGDRLVVRDDDSAHLWRIEDGDVGAALETEATVIPLPPQRQGEGVDFLPDGVSIAVNSEGRNQPIFRVPLPEEFRSGAVAQQAEAPARRAPTGPPAADLAGSRDMTGPLVAGVALWAAAVVGGLLLWRRNKGQS